MIFSSRFLYRYYSNYDFIVDTITNKRIYFSSPKDFNDPFDCRPKFSLHNCKKDEEKYWELFLFYLAKEQYHGITDEEALKHASAAIEKKLHKNNDWLLECEKQLSIAINESIKDLRICCFSKSPRNPMMWTHYANNHKGMVLQFRSSYMADYSSGEFRAFDVDYYSRPFSLKKYVESMEHSLKGDLMAFAQLVYCSKSYEWSNEQEVRFFSRKEYVTYPDNMLTGILFGSECPFLWKNLIHQSISSWKTKPRIFREESNQTSIKFFSLVNKNS